MGAKVIGWLVALFAVVLTAVGVIYFYGGFGGFRYAEPAYDSATLPHISAGKALDFTNGQNRQALLSGWSASEPQGVWSDGHTAYLGFLVDGGPDQSTPQALVLKAGAYLVPDKLATQKLEVWSSGRKVVGYTLQPSDKEIVVPLQGLDLTAGAAVILGLYLPDASSPNDLGRSADARLLGIRLVSVVAQ